MNGTNCVKRARTPRRSPKSTWKAGGRRRSSDRSMCRDIRLWQRGHCINHKSLSLSHTHNPPPPPTPTPVEQKPSPTLPMMEDSSRKKKCASGVRGRQGNGREVKTINSADGGPVNEPTSRPDKSKRTRPTRLGLRRGVACPLPAYQG